MEQEHVTRIQDHLHDLVTHTIIEAPFLEYFIQNGVLGFSDIDHIASQQTDGMRSTEFYKIIQTRTNAYQLLLDGLKATNQHAVVRFLETGVIATSLEVRSRIRKRLYDLPIGNKRYRMDIPLPHQNITYNLPPVTSLFTGRRKELEELHKQVLRGGGGTGVTVISQTTSISGLGGIGKTQLSLQYISEYSAAFDGNCIWMTAETETELGKSFRTLAKDLLNISTKDANGTEKKIEMVVADIYRFFQVSKCLFVFDNAEPEGWLRKFLPFIPNPHGSFLPYIILTSRNSDWDSGIEVLNLAELQEADAALLVTTGLGLEGTEEDQIVLKLVRRLQCYPLALRQAISYIKDQREMDDYPISEYLEDFERKQEQLLSFLERKSVLQNDYSMTTYTTWKLTVDKIAQDKDNGQVAILLLSAMAYIAPDKIEREMFLKLPGISGGSDLREGIRLLVKYSMIRAEDKQKKILSIHRLVQEVTRSQLIDDQKEFSTLDGVLQMLGGGPEDQNLLNKNVEHVLGSWTHAWKHSELIKSHSYLNHLVVSRLFERGDDSEALKFGNGTVDKLAEVVGQSHTDVLQTQHNMVLSLHRQQRIDEAFKLLNQVLEKRKLLLGEDHPHTLSSMNILGVLYYNQYMFEEALPLQQSLVERRSRTLHENHKELLTSKQNLANVLWKMGRYEEAVKIFQDIYPRTKLLPMVEKHRVISIRCAFGRCLNEFGRFDEALKILHEDHQELEGLEGQERIQTIYLNKVIGIVQRNLGDYETALKMHLEAHSEFVSIFGRGHLYPLLCLTEIARDYSGMGNDEEAVSILGDIMSPFEKLAGEEHYFVIRAKLVYADVMAKEGKKLDEVLAVLEGLKKVILKMGWEKLPYFKNGLGKEIEKIESDVIRKRASE